MAPPRLPGSIAPATPDGGTRGACDSTADRTRPDSLMRLFTRGCSTVARRCRARGVSTHRFPESVFVLQRRAGPYKPADLRRFAVSTRLSAGAGSEGGEHFLE